MLTVLLILFPLFSGLLVYFLKGSFARNIALTLSVIEFCIALGSFFMFKHNPGHDALSFNHSWVKSLGINFSLAIDGMGLLMVLLTTFLVPLIILSSFKNQYNNNHQKGIYVSAATGEPLFSSDDKYESGSGWPSFTKAIKAGVITVVTDNSHGMIRDEVIETKTGLHLGHVFDDGPKEKGGKRYCMNSAALKFIKK